MSHPWTCATLESGGEDIYYESCGDSTAPTVVLTHGAGGSHAVWFQQVPALLDAGYRVVTWDCRGFGNSSFRTGVHGCDATVADLRAVIDAAGAEQVHLAGQSMGGWWVTAFTVAAPERVRTLTLSNTVGGLWTDDLLAHFRGLFARARPNDDAFVGEHTAVGASFAARDPAHAFLYQQLNTFHTPPMTEIGRALATSSIEPSALDATNTPVLVIMGSDDALFPPKLLRPSVEHLARVQIVEIADAGHSPYFERPDEYNTALLSFISPAR